VNEVGSRRSAGAKHALGARPGRPPAHRRWSWLVAVAAVLGLVLTLRPALGQEEQESTGRTVPSTPTAADSTPAVDRNLAADGTGSSRNTQGTSHAPIPRSASGRLTPVPGREGPSGPGRTLTYRLEIEAELPLERTDLARHVHRLLTDPRGWQPIEGVAFARTDGPAAFELIVASPALTDRLCYPLLTMGELSCRNGDRVILNARRWVTAVPWYAGHLDDYRAYLVNHEVGHRLGHNHEPCPRAGAPAPVMMQQSKGIGGCRPNPWPSVAP